MYVLIFVWDLNHAVIFWKKAKCKTSKKILHCILAASQCKYWRGSNSVVVYMTSCSQMTEVRI